MKNKKILIVGMTIILLCLLLVLFLIFSSDIFGAIKKEVFTKELKNIKSIEYVLLNDNRQENYFGGEYIEKDPIKCKELTESISKELEEAKFAGTRENFLGGFCLIVRISDGEKELRLWFYEDKIEIENKRDIIICRTNSSKTFELLLSLTEK